MPTLTQLEYILAVDRTGHFGRAAESCYVAQPTLSVQVRKAETELGLTLFDRTQKPVVATPRGRRIIEHAQDVVAAHERLLWKAREGRDQIIGTFALGVIPTLAPYVVPWFLTAFKTRCPLVELTLREQPTDEIIEALHHQRLDAAILATPLEEPRIAERPLFLDPFHLYAHTDDPLLQRESVSRTDLEPSRLWLLEDGHCVRSQVVTFCKLRRPREPLDGVSFAAGSFETLRHLIDAAGGYSLFPATYVRTLTRGTVGRQVRSFDDGSPTREVSLVHLESSWKLDVLQALEESIVETIPRALREAHEDRSILPIR